MMFVSRRCRNAPHTCVLHVHALMPGIGGLQVSRQDCFQDGCQLAQSKGLLDSAAGACLISPTFESPSCQGDVELESGQGPRREFFRLAGAGMLSQAGESAHPPPQWQRHMLRPVCAEHWVLVAVNAAAPSASQVEWCASESKQAVPV